MQLRLGALERAAGIARSEVLSDCAQALPDHAAVVRDDYYVRGIKVC